MNRGGMQGMYYGASPKLMEYAHWMRDHPTAEELIIWNNWCANPLPGYNLRRQHPIATFIADFYCHKVKLVIEIDGDSHQRTKQKEYDNFRNEDMQKLGIQVLRVSNAEVLNDPEGVLNKIKHLMTELTGKPQEQ